MATKKKSAPTEAEIRSAIAKLEKLSSAPRATKTFRLLAYQSIETMRWSLGEAEHPMASVLGEES